MNEKNKKLYGPDERMQYELKPKIIKAYSKSDYILLPDPVTDPIVCNDISTWEFDYTYKEYKY